ncbi:SdrD B-like domain-containing protein, partial [Nitratifractor sp.]
ENYDPAKLTVDPEDGDQTVVFHYTTTDRAGVESDPATVTMPFLGEMKIGDTVWLDSNGNGAQDPGEAGVADVTVTLYDENGTVVATTRTDAEGHYQFTVQAPGRYRVEFDRDHYYTIHCPPCDDANDSNVEGLNNGTDYFALDWGDVNMTIDAGVAPVAHIGDYVWIDENHNGVQDPGEKPAEGVVVELYDAEGNPITDIHGNHSVTTDENGRYGFDVEPGKSYRLRFVLPEDLQREGYVFTVSGAGDDVHDSDVDEEGFTVRVTPKAGQNILVLDAGIDCGCDREGASNDSGSAMGLLGGMAMSLLGAMMGLAMIRREERRYRR